MLLHFSQGSLWPLQFGATPSPEDIDATIDRVTVSQPMASQNILILTSNTGGGHRSAANALENSLTTLSPGRILVKMTQVLEESHFFCRQAAEFYNFLLRDHQNLMKYYFWAINKLKPNESGLVFKSALNYGLTLFEKVVPSVIVSVHPMTQHFFAYILKRLNLQDRIPLLTVVTDPYQGFWKGWACEDVSQYYVATDKAKEQLIDFGVGSHKIQVVGMPVHSKFQPVSEDEKRLFKQELGLDPDKFTVFMNAGWVGGGNIPQIYEALIQQGRGANLDIQTVFLSGWNEELRIQAEHMAQSAGFPVRVMGFTDEIDRVMKASDVMVSKLGGLTTFEALSCRLPIIADTVTPPMPQEAQTADFLKATGAGVLLKRPDQIVPLVQSLIEYPHRYQELREAATLHGRPGASDLIAKDVLRYLEQAV
jgi:processive 1,2-diacylglycerol beta-glucosyltransferase